MNIFSAFPCSYSPVRPADDFRSRALSGCVRALRALRRSARFLAVWNCASRSVVSNPANLAEFTLRMLSRSVRRSLLQYIPLQPSFIAGQTRFVLGRGPAR